eukprot:SAG11_NODE_8633_length_993_cov_1.381432_2_plen_56_part_01
MNGLDHLRLTRHRRLEQLLNEALSHAAKAHENDAQLWHLAVIRTEGADEFLHLNTV